MADDGYTALRKDISDVFRECAELMADDSMRAREAEARVRGKLMSLQGRLASEK